MTEPSQYFKGRTVQEQMNEIIGYVDTRAAEVATDAIASDVAQVHQDMLDADADASAAAASAAAAAGTLANAVKKTGESSQSIEGDVTLTTGGLGVAGDAGVQGQLAVLGGCDLRAPVKIPVTPVNNDDAASKKYVDDADATKISITDINSYAVGLTGNQGPIAGSKEFTGGLYNSIITSTINKVNENVGGKCIKVMHIPANTNVCIWYKIYMNNPVIMTGIIDIRTASVAMNVANKTGTDSSYDESCCIIARKSDGSCDIYMKYRQNRRFNITIEKILNPFANNESPNVSSIIDFSPTLVDYPTVSGDITSISTSTQM